MSFNWSQKPQLDFAGRSFAHSLFCRTNYRYKYSSLNSKGARQGQRGAGCSICCTSAPQHAPSDVPSRFSDIPEARQKELRKLGLALKDQIKLGRRGVAEGLVQQIYNRWNTSEVVKLYCHGKQAVNMKLVHQQLEARTGGVVVHRTGGVVFLYRAGPWPRAPPPPPPLPEQDEEQEEGGAVGQH